MTKRTMKLKKLVAKEGAIDPKELMETVLPPRWVAADAQSLENLLYLKTRIT